MPMQVFAPCIVVADSLAISANLQTNAEEPFFSSRRLNFAEWLLNMHVLALVCATILQVSLYSPLNGWSGHVLGVDVTQSAKQLYYLRQSSSLLNDLRLVTIYLVLHSLSIKY